MTSSSASRSTPRPDGGAGPGRRRGLLLALAILAVALGLRWRAVDHGMPRNYVPDTHLVRSALGMAQEKSLAPPVGRYSTYPNLLPYLLLPLYGGHFALGVARGDWEGVEGFKEHLLEHPEGVHGIARRLMVVLGALASLAILLAARASGATAGAWFAAWFTATGLMHLHFSVQERPWIGLVLFASLAAWPAALYAARPSARRLLLCGAAAALGAACHQSGMFLLALPGLAWLTSPRGWRGEDLVRRLVEGALCVGLFLGVAVLVGYPAYLVHGLPEAERTIGGGRADVELGGQAMNLGRDLSHAPRLFLAILGYDPVVLVLGLAGLASLVRRRAGRPVVLFTLLWLAFFLTYSNPHIRYLLPGLALLAVPAGEVAGGLFARGGPARLAALLLAAVTLAPAWQLGSLLAAEDTRAAGEALLEELPAGSVVLVDRYGPVVDQDLATLEELARVRAATGGELGRREARRLEGLRAGELEGGVRAHYVADLFLVDELHRTAGPRPGLEALHGATVAEVLASLGVTHALLVDRIAVGGEADPLLAELGGAGALPEVARVSPCAGEAAPGCELRLPMEMDFPWTSLWRLERSGPELRLVRLP
jgi:hypothetical protein